MDNQIVTANDEVEVDLGEIFSLLLSRIWLILLCGILAAAIAVIGTMLFITPQYRSTTKMYVLTKQDNSTLTNSDMQISTLLTKDYAELIKSRTVIEGVIARQQLDLTYEQLLQKVSVDTTTDTRIISINVMDEDPYTAAQIADAVRDLAADHIQSVMDTQAVNVVDYANIPSKKASPSLTRNGMIGGILGVLLMMVIVIAVHLSNDTIVTQEDVERYLGLSVLGSIPLSTTDKKPDRKKKRKTERNQKK